jgi:hypothetical protein
MVEANDARLVSESAYAAWIAFIKISGHLREISADFQARRIGTCLVCGVKETGNVKMLLFPPIWANDVANSVLWS